MQWIYHILSHRLNDRESRPLKCEIMMCFDTT